MSKKKNKFIAYCAEGYSVRRDIGAYAYVILQGGVERMRCSCVRTGETNNRMEMISIINAINALPYGCEVTVYSTSQYAIDALRDHNWGRKNEDLKYVYRELVDKNSITVTFEWIRGHRRNPFLKICYDLCNQIVGFDLYRRGEWIKKIGL